MPVSMWQIVCSKSGRDRGRYFIVIKVSGEYAWLIDGELRPVERPKMKKFKHIQQTKNFVDEKFQNSNLTNSDVKKALVQYTNTKSVFNHH